MADNREAIGDFKPGSITRIKLKNFLTYSYVEFEPGPRLNMVIGANGTGKSSVLCAICLGLGGEPKLLGRADDARSFIMNEKDVAYVELTLEPHEDGKVHVLKRKIDRNKGSERGNGRGASTFYINDQKVNIKDVQKLVRETYSITVDNLLSFLPQDKVGSFSGFNPQELLIETEKTLAQDQRVYKEHLDLIEAEQELNSGDHNVEAIQAKRDKLMTEKQRFEREKERMEEREEAVRQLELLEKKLLWSKYNELQSEVKQLKEEKKETKAAYVAAHNEVEPLKKQEQKAQNARDEIEARHKKLEQQLGRYKSDLTKSEKRHEAFDDAIESVMADLKAIDADRNNKKAIYENAKEKVQSIEKSLAEIQSAKDIEKEYNEAVEEKKVAHRKLANAKQNLGRVKREFDDLEEQSNQLSNKLAKLQDEKAQRRQNIGRHNPNVLHIMEWLDKNRKQFRRPVYGPVSYEVSTNSKNAAAFLEAHMNRGLLYSFIVQDKEDYDLLFKKVRTELKKPISINLVRGERELKRPYSDEKFAKLKRDYGVIGYLDESLIAPGPVMQALRSFAQVHRVLIGDEETQRSLDERGLIDFLSAPDKSLNQQGKQASCIFASSGRRTKKYTQTVSRYNKEVSSRIDDVEQARVLAPGVDPDIKKNLEADLQRVHDQVNKVRPAMEDAEKEKSDLEKAGQQVSARLTQAKESIELYKKLRNRLRTATNKMEDAEKDLQEDDQAKKRELAQSMMSKVAESITALENHAASHEKLMQFTCESAGVRIDRDAQQARCRKIRDELEEKLGSVRKLEKIAEEKAREFNVKKQKLRDLKEHNDREAALQNEDGSASELRLQLEELELDSVEDVEAAIDEAKAKVNSIHHDPNAIKQYEKNLAEIEAVEAQLEKVLGSKDALDRRIQTQLVPWKATLETSVSEASKLFSNYMEEVGCTGEVRLRKGGDSGNEDSDFKNWGVEIRVSFREGVKAQVLSAQVHSGGERSVSTIMFLMALQERMIAPFRAVDEINQGLDERNERLVFRRIVMNSCQPPPEDDPTDHCGQYFLITPKLLPNLVDMENPALTVLVVMNGPFNFDSPLDWNVDTLLKKRRRIAAQASANEEEENQPDGGNKRSGQRRKKRRSS